MITVPLKLYIHVRKSMICYLDRPQERTLGRKDDKSRKIDFQMDETKQTIDLCSCVPSTLQSV